METPTAFEGWRSDMGGVDFPDAVAKGFQNFYKIGTSAEFRPVEQAMHDDSSRRLIEQLEQGDQDAPRQVFDRYVRRLLGLVRRRMSPRLQQRVDAEDVVQSALRSFFVRSADAPYAWRRSGDLWRLLATVALSKLRRQVERHTADKRRMAKEDSPSNGPDFALLGREPSPDEQAALVDELSWVLASLEPARRDVLQRRLASEPIEEIAERLGRSQRTVRRWLQEMQELLERRLQDGGRREPQAEP